MHEKPLGFGRLHENIFFCFFEMEIYFLNFLIFFEVLEETRYF
jgi:hypothetical protein